MCKPADGRPISASPGTIDRPSTIRSRSTSADDEAGEVVLAVGVEAWHFGGFAAEQGAAVVAAAACDAADDLLGDVGREPPGRQVIEKEQRTRALHQDVVDAVVHQIGADGVVTSGHEGDFQLGADAVGARDQHRLAQVRGVELEESAERSDFGQHPGSEGARAPAT